MIYSLALFISVGLAWFGYLSIGRRLDRLESAVYSSGLAIAFPILVLIFFSTLHIPLNFSSIVVSFILSMIPPGALYVIKLSKTARPDGRQNSFHYLSPISNAITLKKLQLLTGAILLLASFAIISLKWHEVAENNSLIFYGSDVARLNAVTQIIVSTGKIPSTSETIHFDGPSPIGALPALQLFNSIPLILEDETITSAVNFSALVFLLLGSFYIFMIVYALTTRFDISGVASLLFGAGLVFIYPNNSIVASYSIFPLLFYATIRYIQSGPKLSLFFIFIFSGMLFLTHHGTSLFGMTVFLIIIIISSLSGTRLLKERSFHAALLVTVWFGLVAAAYTIIFQVPLDEFFRFYTGYWQYAGLGFVEELRTLAPAMVVGTIFSPLFIYNLLSTASSKLIKLATAVKKILYPFKDVAILPTLALVMAVFVVAVATGNPTGDDFLRELSRNTNVAYLPITMTALAFFLVRRQMMPNSSLGMLVAYCVPFFVGVTSIALGISSTGDTTERFIPFTHPILAVLAAIAVMVHSTARRRPVQIASIIAVGSVLTVSAAWSLTAINEYYHTGYQDFITGIEDFRRNHYRGEVVAYDFAYVSTFTHFDPDIYIDRTNFPNPDNMTRMLSDRNVSYIITSQTESRYWNGFFESTGLYHEIVLRAPSLTIYKIDSGLED